MKEQRDDESLEKARELADKELERFCWKDGLLVHREDASSPSFPKCYEFASLCSFICLQAVYQLSGPEH